MKFRAFLLAGLCLAAVSLLAESPLKLPFAGHWTYFGRGNPRLSEVGATLQDGFAQAVQPWGDCEFSFMARAPLGSPQVQIWAGFHGRDRLSRYVFALRGGDNNDVYLARYAPDGGAEFLGVAPLDFKPQPGIWYTLKLLVKGNRFQLYVNHDALPRINIADDAPLWPKGAVSLGGGWLPVEFKEARVSALSARAAAAFDAVGDAVWQAPGFDKEARRKVQRAAYQPLQVPAFQGPRQEISLDGPWLFMPEGSAAQGADPALSDEAWHVMDVPNLWTPTLSWLHGETGFNKLPGVAATKGICDKVYLDEISRLDSYTFDWNQTKSAWYRQHLRLPADISGKNFELDFDAVAKVSEVWVNGVLAGSHTGMFGGFKLDVSKLLKPGENLIAVHVSGSAGKKGPDKVLGVAVSVEVTQSMLQSLPHGMYRDDAAGIWQPVKLVVTNPVSVHDIFVIPKLDGARAELEIANSSGSSQKIELSYKIIDSQDNSILYASSSPEKLRVAVGSSQVRIATPKLAPQLWSPQNPNLYRLEIEISAQGQLLDRDRQSFGFRTFQVSGNRFLLNGKPYWLRGADHFPSALRPNDTALAAKFMQLAHAGNVRVTRTHTAPFSETWLEAADRAGVAVSYEGGWPWLMMKGEPPSPALLKAWSEEYASLIHQYRNHPSILLWTVNNEMNFEGFDKKKPVLLKKKWKVLDSMIKEMRALDPTRPVVADSGYTRKKLEKEYEQFLRPNGFDDGDVDDAHRYYGWYNESFFHLFHGEFGKDLGLPNRPLISQEMSTGYPRNDDGHPTRFYLFRHQNPQTYVGDEAWENRDPQIFLKRQAFMTKELAEVLRRTGRDNVAGILHFAYLSWFKDVWNAATIQPWPAYTALKTALQPVLVSAELYGRHFYAGDVLKRRVCLVNDSEDWTGLAAGRLIWEIRSGSQVLSQGSQATPALGYYENCWMDVDFKMPAEIPAGRVDAQLYLRLECSSLIRSENRYDIVVASHAWAERAGEAKQPKLMVIGRAPGLAAVPAADALRKMLEGGARILWIHPGDELQKVFPEAIQSYRATDEGEIVSMQVPESPAFKGLEPLDLSWFELGGGQIPLACSGTYRFAFGNPSLKSLAWEIDKHAYLKSPQDLIPISGSPLLELRLGKGRLIASEMMTDAAGQDPLAQRLLSNLEFSLGR